MEGCRKPFNPFILLCLLLVPAAWAQGPDPDPEPEPEYKIEKGFDLFRTLPEFASEQSFVNCPVPGLTFEAESDQALSGCDTFDGSVLLSGRPLDQFRGFTVGAIDTIVERKETLEFGAPMTDVTAATPIELVALSLGSIHPIEIACDQGTTQWDVAVEVDPSTGVSGGTMSVTLEAPGLTGGTASSSLEICPRVTFTRVDAGGSGSFEIYPCDLLCGPQLFGETNWAFEEPANAPAILKIPGFTTDNFFFVEAPEPTASAAPLPSPSPSPGPGPTPEGAPAPDSVTYGEVYEEWLREAKAAANKDHLECECGFLYPHLSPDHRHQACGPCPCDADIVGPSVTPPDEPVPPFECTGKANGVGVLRSDESPATEWLEDVFCSDELSGIDRCRAANVPVFFELGDPSPACVGRTTVQFVGADNCGNETVVTSTIAVQDTNVPIVVAGGGDLGCLEPSNGGVICFDQEAMPEWPFDFEFEKIIADFTDDLCSDVADWWFTGCESDQPDNGTGDGNTTGDCTVGPAPDHRSRTICVRAERGPSPEGRRYAIEIQAEDECGNVGEPAVIGFVHVPKDDPPAGQCIPGSGCGAGPCKLTCKVAVEGDEAPLAVAFSHQATGGCGTEDAEWEWTFGDGATSTDANSTNHTYSSAGTYQPTLTVTTNVCDLNPVTAQCPEIVVGDPPPPPQPMIVAACSADPSSGVAPLAVMFTDQSTAKDTVITSWSWDFEGDGMSNAQNPSHLFEDPGTYDVTLTVADDDGLSDTATCTVVVGDPPPPPGDIVAACDATVDPSNPLDVTFTDQSTATDTTITSWQWNFQDGNTSPEQNPAHTYAAGGVYAVTLTVSDDNGVTDTATCPVTVASTCFVDLGAGGGAGQGLEIDVADVLGIPGVTVTAIEQDEPLRQNGNQNRGCGNQTPDACIGSPASIIEIRPEACANPSGNDRFYHIRLALPDGATPPCGGTLRICKPQNQGGGGTCEDANDDGPLFDSTDGGASCPI